ncbi:MAG: SpoIIE family protein phosphatase [Bacteroidales bacterium]|nr:SpoIIE family protein phosphatase [Bacteroidales bacterium]
MKKRLIILFLLLISITTSVFSQIKNLGTTPLINYYSPDQYNAARQNWAVVQDKRGIMYFGNNDGSVLEFDGNNWNRLEISELGIRSLCVDNNNLIFVGGNNLFGYFSPDERGNLKFNSLNHLFPKGYENFREVWDIFLTKDSTIFFHTFDEIFIYDYDTIKVYPIEDYYADGLFNISFKLNEEIYIFTKWKGLYRLTNNDLKFIPESEAVDSSMVRAVLPYKSNKKIIFTWFDGAFEFNEDDKITHIVTPIDTIIKNNSYRVFDIKNKYFGFLLYSGGLLITDKDFNIIQFLKSPNDLKNDIFYKSFIDNQDNLWLCSNNGINSIYLFSPFSKYDKNYGFDNESTCLTPLLYNENLLIGTNSGIYTKPIKTFENKINITQFNIIEDAGFYKTQQISNIQGDILVATEGGLFKLIDQKIEQILKSRTVRVFEVANDDPNTIIGISAAIFIFKKQEILNPTTNTKEYKWVFFKDIQGFEGSFMKQDKDGFFWISDLVNGVVKIEFNDDYSDIKQSTKFFASDSSLNGLPRGKDIKLFKVFDDVVFATTDGLYSYNKLNNNFEPYNKINQYLGNHKSISLIYEDNKHNIWLKKEIATNDKSNWELTLLKNTDTGYVVIEKPFLYLRNKIFSFYQISDNEYIIGNSTGFTHYDANMEFDTETNFPVFIRSVKINTIDSLIFGGSFLTSDSLIGTVQLQQNIPIIPHKYGNLRFTFAGAYFQITDKMEYMYFLEGNDEKWSDWTQENYKDFSNLKPGEYTFYVKAKNFYGTESSTASYKFVIKPPIYQTLLAYIIYLIVAAFLVWLIVYWYTRRLRKQKEYLEFQVQQRTKEIAQQNIEIQAQRDELENKNEKIQKINKDLTDSIEYAKRIQTAMLPLAQNINLHLPENFILFKPRDIVSGDFYWFTQKNDKIFIAAVDCTGHGVPGAFMSMIGAEILTTIVNNKEVVDAANILELLNEYVRTALKQDTTENQDGMDMALCVIDKQNKTLEFSGAKNPLFHLYNNELFKIRGNKQSIGGYQFDTFKKHVIKYESPSWFYIFSDGYADQFGGPENTKFMIKQFREILLENFEKPLNQQKEILDKRVTDWMEGTRQTDDILVIGFKL